jgi:ArsR family transcriptional regulator
MPPRDDILKASELFKTCGDATRAGIICALMGRELCVCDLAEVLSMTSSAISHQLRILKHMQLTKTRRSGKSIFYSLSDDHVSKIFQTAFELIRED